MKVWPALVTFRSAPLWVLASVKLSRSAAFVLIAVCACGHARPAASIAPTARAVPVYQEPRHRLVYHNSVVRVLDVRVGPGDTTGYHVHADPLVGIMVQDARTWAQV